ncbi:OmpP1/FadL family transporter [Pseudomonas sp. NPDC087358]|uniref:OmpP1/FadL family transporter n=1 Tax=Pseudomonas sp. NPDC087358 TaxID=3364439 RepID=UPI00384A7014
MKKTMIKSSLSLAITLASTQIFASGFALNEQSISGMGTGFAGRSSSADDASIVYGNPAGMSRLKRQQVTGGVAAIDAKTDISDTSGRSAGSNKGDMVPFTAVPMGFYVKPIDDQWAFGLGVYAPFGLITDYENGFQGRNFGSKSQVKVITFQPTVSYAFNDKVSIGFGPTINRISGVLESALNVSGLTLPATGRASGDGRVQVKGDDVGYGFNAGILVQATDSTSVGLTYHSKVTYKLEGHTEVTPGAGVPAQILGAGRYDAKLSLDTPESVDFSVTQKLNDDWKLYAGTTWTRWSRLQDITVRNSGVTRAGGGAAPALLGTITEEQNWHDTWAYAIGTSYQLNKQWVLRTGLSLDQSPTNNDNRSPRIPTGDRTIFSLGAGYSPTDDITIDVAYSYLKEEDIKVRDANALGQTYNAKYENSANGFGLGLTYRF